MARKDVEAPTEDRTTIVQQVRVACADDCLIGREVTGTLVKEGHAVDQVAHLVRKEKVLEGLNTSEGKFGRGWGLECWAI